MNRRRFLAVLVLVAGAAFGFVAPALAAFDGLVVAVIDGDTLDVLVDRQPVRVRLAQIDAPENHQAFGQRAKQALAALVFRRSVTVAGSGSDRYGRVLGTVFVADTDVNAEMVRQGMAWVYRRYATDQSLYDLEAEARSARRGLWADPSPVPPWEFRHHARP